MKNKKAISELISTVLLVGFAVAIAALVMNWNRGYIEDTADNSRIESEMKVTCNLNIGLGIDDVDGVQQICYDKAKNRIRVVLENSRNTQIEDVQSRVSTNLSVYGPSKLYTDIDPSSVMLSIDSAQAVVAYINMTHIAGTNYTINLTNESIEKITIFPGILVQNKVRLCADSSIEVTEPINNCN